MVAGAGLDVKNQTIFVADPDTNRGSSLPNAGWPNIKTFPGDLKSTSKDPFPIPQNPKIGDSTSYNTYYGGFTLNKNNNVITGDNADARFTGTTLDAIRSVGAQKGKKVGAVPVPGGIETSVGVVSGSTTVDKVFIAPFAQVLSVTAFPSLFSFASPGDTWDSLGETSDPFGNPLSFGGVEYDLLTGPGLEPGDAATAMLGTAADFTGFDIFLHVAGDPLTLWDPETIGGPPNPLDDWLVQSDPIPEPPTLQLLLTSFGLLGLAARSRRRSSLGAGSVGERQAHSDPTPQPSRTCPSGITPLARISQCG
jgi:hypothetical protein